MSNNPQQDQYDNQDQQSGGMFGNQDQTDQQQNDPNQYGQQPDLANAQQDQTQQQDAGPLGDVRRTAGERVNQGIDDVANRIPGGDQYAQKAKDAASGGMDRLQQEGENRGGERLGGMFGGNQDNP